MADEESRGDARSEMTDEQQPANTGSPDLATIPSLAIKVITDPVGFYKSMSKSGGYAEPLLFMVVLAVVAGVISAVLGMAGFGMAGAMTGGLIAIIMVPIFVVIFSFIGAGIAYLIWKLMGSQQDFETAFRCVAYTSAIAPINAILVFVPYAGSVISSLWPMALLAIASIYVHKRSTQVAWGVFGALGILFALINVNGERASRVMADRFDGLEELLEESRR